MDKKIVVTGGAGFIGSHLVKRLLDDNWHVLVIDDFNSYYDPRFKESNISEFGSNENFRLERGDIVDGEFVKQTIADFAPSHVVHLAARAGVRPSLEDPKLYTEVNILGTLNILEATKGLDIQNFVFGSSSSVYGENKKTPFAEEDRLENQISPYAVTKRSGELLCKMYAHNEKMPMTCLRFFTVYGPRQRPDLAIRKFMQRILNDEEIEMYGDGSTSRDYTFVEDIVDGIIKSIENPFDFEIINLGNSSPVTLREMINAVEKAVGKKANIVERPLQKGDVSRTYAAISKAKKLLDWQPKMKFEDGLKIMAEWINSSAGGSI